MKRFYKLLGIAALAAVIAIGLAGCPNGNDDDKKGGIRISTIISRVIYIDVGEGLSNISGSDLTVQNALKANFEVTINDTPVDVTGVNSVGATVNKVSFMELVLTVDTDSFTEGTSYAIKVKYTKGTTPITFQDGSELGNFEIAGTIKAE